MRAPFSRNLFDLLVEQSERYPEQLAVISGRSRVTYSDLVHYARQVSTALREAGIGRGDPVGILMNNRLEWLQVCFGVAALGAVLFPFSTWSRRSEIDVLLADSNVKVLVTLERFGDVEFAHDIATLVPECTLGHAGQWRSTRFPALEHIVVLDSAPFKGGTSYSDFFETKPALQDIPPPGEGALPEEPAVVLYTSGSTAQPKAVPLTHRGIIENGFNIGERQGLRPGDRVLLIPPLFWSYGCANAMGATFTHGGTLVLQAKFDPAEAIDLIESHACTSLYTLPGITSAIVHHPLFHVKRARSLRTGMTLGTPRDIQIAAEVLGAREVCNEYGQTESYGNCCATWHHWPLEQRMQVQGPPLPGVQVRIVDPESGVEITDDRVGLIEVKGYLTPGYHGASADLNSSAFTSDGFFRTGDLGRLTSEGYMQFVCRDTEMIKKGGINIAPIEVEELLQQHPAVIRAGVVGAPDPEKGQIIVAFVVIAPGVDISIDQLRAHCRALAASYKTPDHIEFCKTLPATTTGKLLRRELKTLAAALGTKEAVQP